MGAKNGNGNGEEPPVKPVEEKPLVEVKPTAFPDYQKWVQLQALGMYGAPHSTGHRRGYGYYQQTDVPARKKALYTTLGIATTGAVVEGLISASRMFDPGIEYAQRELAEAEALQREDVPEVSHERAEELRAQALAPARTEVAEIKSDVGALMASRQQGATVADLLRVREAGVQELATAGLEGEALIGREGAELRREHGVKAQRAEMRADQMTQAIDDLHRERKEKAEGLVRDVFKIGAEVAAEMPSKDERPAMDRMLEGKMTMEEVTAIHDKAVNGGFMPGTHPYNTYMMAAYSDWKEKNPDRFEEERKSVPTVEGAPHGVRQQWSEAEGPSLGYLGKHIEESGRRAEDFDFYQVGKTFRAIPKGATLTNPQNPTEKITGTQIEPTPEQLNVRSGILGSAFAGGILAPRPSTYFRAGGATLGKDPTPVDVKGRTAAITQIQQGFSADETADLYSLADKAGLKKEDYTFERAIKPTGDEAPKWQPVSNEPLGGDPIYRIKLKEGVKLEAPTPVKGEGVELTKFETHEKFWTGSDWGRKEADQFRVWVREKYPAYTSKVPEMGGMDGDDNAGLSSSGTFDSKNATFSAVWDKHGAEYLKWKATQSTAK